MSKPKTNSDAWWETAHVFLDECSEQDLAVFVTMVRTRQAIFADPWWRKLPLGDVKHWLESQHSKDHIEYRIVKKYYGDHKYIILE